MKLIQLKEGLSDEYFTREAYKALRTNIQFCGTDVKVIAFTSCEAHEGKTTICVELARALAESGKKVLLVDADMRKSVMVSRYSDETGIVGLSQYLSGMVAKDDVIYTTENEGFDIIFAGKFPPNPVELLGGNAFKSFIEEEKSVYDYILIDTPPVGLVIDGAVVASVCDSAVIVVSIGVVKYRYVQNAKQQLEKSGCRILGVVLNHVVKKSEQYYKKYYGKYQGNGYYTHYGKDEEKAKYKSEGLLH